MKNFILLIALSITSIVSSQIRTGKDVYKSLEAGAPALMIIHPLNNETHLFQDISLKGSIVSTINPNPLFVLDIVKDINCNYKFRVLAKNGSLGWVSGCDNLHFSQIDLAYGIKKLNKTEEYNDNLFQELKKIYHIYTNFLIENNSLINEENKIKYEDGKLFFSCDYDLNSFVVDNKGEVINVKDGGKVTMYLKEKNVLEFTIQHEKIFLEGIPITNISSISYNVTKFLQNGGGLSPLILGKSGDPCDYCTGLKNPESSDHPKKAFISITKFEDNKANNYQETLLFRELRKAYNTVWKKISLNKKGRVFNQLSCEERNSILKNFYPVNIIYNKRLTHNIYNFNRFRIAKNEEEIEEYGNTYPIIEVEESIPFSIVEIPPIYPGCVGTPKELKGCFNEKLKKQVYKLFDISSFKSKLGLSKGVKRVFVSFKIDKTGKVVDIKARAPHKRLQEEAIRVIKLIPSMTPGKQRGKAVGVKSRLPIVFKID